MIRLRSFATKATKTKAAAKKAVKAEAKSAKAAVVASANIGNEGLQSPWKRKLPTTPQT